MEPLFSKVLPKTSRHGFSKNRSRILRCLKNQTLSVRTGSVGGFILVQIPGLFLLITLIFFFYRLRCRTCIFCRKPHPAANPRIRSFVFSCTYRQLSTDYGHPTGATRIVDDYGSTCATEIYIAPQQSLTEIDATASRAQTGGCYACVIFRKRKKPVSPRSYPVTASCPAISSVCFYCCLFYAVRFFWPVNGYTSAKTMQNMKTYLHRATPPKKRLF